MDAQTFFDMGGYAMHVWGSYGLVIIVCGGLLAHSLARLARLKKQEEAKGKK